MKFDIVFNSPQGWNYTSETFIDESGAEVTHIEAHGDKVSFDAYVGEMPEGETAEDQAFANYAETVGFDNEEEEEDSPVCKFKFNGKSAWGFEAWTEDECPMRFIAQEVRKGVLLIIVYCCDSDDLLNPSMEMLERCIRVK